MLFLLVRIIGTISTYVSSYIPILITVARLLPVPSGMSVYSITEGRRPVRHLSNAGILPSCEEFDRRHGVDTDCTQILHTAGNGPQRDQGTSCDYPIK